MPQYLSMKFISQVLVRKWLEALALLGMVMSCHSQPLIEKADSEKTLLWQISGNGLKQPSYFYGTMHVLCPTDARLSPQVQQVLQHIKKVYFEIDLDDMMQIFGSLKSMNMLNDTHLKELLTPEEYDRVRNYFEKELPLPFAMIENYKPMLLSSMIAEKEMPCEATNGMELVLMGELSKLKIDINGLETMSYQAGLFDSIPYTEQAKELVKAIDSAGHQKDAIADLLKAYRQQDLKKLETLTLEEDPTMAKYLDLLLYQRNRNWVKQFDAIAAGQSTLFAVGAGHLSGSNGVLQLLKKKGYTVTPLKNQPAAQSQ